MLTEKLIKKYLLEGKVMQLATVRDSQPWVCTVYYTADEDSNLYWLSWPDRRHSREIAENNKVAVTVPVKLDQPVIGVQAEGTAEKVTNTQEVEKVMTLYISKYDAGKDFLRNFEAGTNRHAMYKFTPSGFILFDEVSFPTDSRQEENADV